MPWIDIALIVLLVGGIAWYIVHKIQKAKKGVHKGCSQSACASCAGNCHKES